MEEFEILVKTLYGLEEVLEDEIKAIGGKDISRLNRAVKFTGDQELLYKSNICLRTALRVLKPIGSFKVFNDDKLYKKIRNFEWENYFTNDHTFSIEAVTFGEVFTHSKFTSLRVKDAIVDRFRDRTGTRPDVNTENPDIRINVHISDRFCSLSLDSSGDSLDRRGYRLSKNEAPLNEVLAAGIISLSGWDKKMELVDGMCGSGTLLIEAAMIAANMAPGLNRSYAFEKWEDFDKNLIEKVKKDAKERQVHPSCSIRGYDIDRDSIKIAGDNVYRAGVSDFVTIEQADFLETEEARSPIQLVLNPPYGERLKPEGIIDFYKEVGTVMKHKFPGGRAAIISSNLQALKHVGLKPSSKTKLLNGPLECRLNNYEMYRGSRK